VRSAEFVANSAVKAGASVVVVRRQSRSTARKCLENRRSFVGFEFGAPVAVAWGEASFLDDSQLREHWIQARTPKATATDADLAISCM
jgi:hypothetical protein